MAVRYDGNEADTTNLILGPVGNASGSEMANLTARQLAESALRPEQLRASPRPQKLSSGRPKALSAFTRRHCCDGTLTTRSTTRSAHATRPSAITGSTTATRSSTTRSGRGASLERTAAPHPFRRRPRPPPRRRRPRRRPRRRRPRPRRRRICSSPRSPTPTTAPTAAFLSSTPPLAPAPPLRLTTRSRAGRMATPPPPAATTLSCTGPR